MKTVLIVEDNVRSMEMLVKIIENLRTDVEIKTASSQEEAAILAMKFNIDLFMLDIILNASNPGDVSGMKFAEYIRTLQKYKYTPIIFITALEDPELHAYSDLHCYYYVEKPYDVEKVSSVISEALEFPAVHNEPQNVFFRKDGILYKKEISEILYIENSSEKDVTVQVRDESINGFMMDTIFSEDVLSGKRSIDAITFMNSSLEENGIDKIESIEFSFSISAMGDFMDSTKSDIINLTF